MTGYGRGVTGKSAGKVIVLIKAVNGRFLDVKIRGLDIDPSLARQKALKWLQHASGRSGRVARQFVDDLAGRMRLEP